MDARPYTFCLRFTSSIFLVLLRASDLIRRIPLKRLTYVWHRFRFTTTLRDLSYTYLTVSRIYDKYRHINPIHDFYYMFYKEYILKLLDF